MRMWLAGEMMAISLRIMPPGRAKDLLCDALDEWYREVLIEGGCAARDVTEFSVTRRYR